VCITSTHTPFLCSLSMEFALSVNKLHNLYCSLYFGMKCFKRVGGTYTSFF